MALLFFAGDEGLGMRAVGKYNCGGLANRRPVLHGRFFVNFSQREGHTVMGEDFG